MYTFKDQQNIIEIGVKIYTLKLVRRLKNHPDILAPIYYNLVMS